MQTQYLKEFITLSKTLNFSEAAEELYISASTLSKHIKELEKELQVELFTRTTRTVELNEFGKLFLKYAKNIMKEEEHLKNEFHAMKNNTITIASGYRLMESIIKYKHKHPDIIINTFDHFEVNELKEAFLSNKLDLFFAFEDFPLDCPSEIIYQDELIAVLPIDHPIANKQSIKLREIANNNFIMLNSEFSDTIFCVKECQNVGFSPKIMIHADRGNQLVDMVAEGFGVTLLMKHSASFIHNDKVRFIDIVPPIKRNLLAYHSPKKELSNQAQDFLDEIIKDLNSSN